MAGTCSLRHQRSQLTSHLYRSSCIWLSKEHLESGLPQPLFPGQWMTTEILFPAEVSLPACPFCGSLYFSTPTHTRWKGKTEESHSKSLSSCQPVRNITHAIHSLGVEPGSLLFVLRSVQSAFIWTPLFTPWTHPAHTSAHTVLSTKQVLQEARQSWYSTKP